MNSSDPINLQRDEERVGVHLGVLTEHLGDDVVRVYFPSNAVDTTVRAVDFYDAASGVPVSEGALICIVSADALEPTEFERATQYAAQHGCAGIAIKVERGDAAEPTHEDSRLVARIQQAGLPALVVNTGVSWREFDGLVTSALGENAQSLTLAPSTGDKLFALANTIARTFGGSVAIEDHQRSILAHSSVPGQAIDELRTTGILFRRAGDAPVNESRYRQVLEAEGPVRFPRHGDFLPRAAIAVRAGTIPLGSIWVLDPTGDDPEGIPLNLEKSAMLEKAATIVAGALLEAWRASSRIDSRRETALRRILLAAAQQGDREELDPSGDGVGVILIVSVAAGPRSAGRVAEARAVFSRHLAMFIPNVVVSSEANEVVILCPTPRIEQVHEWAESALSDLSEDTATGIQVGISDPHSISNRLPFAANEARDVARHARAANCSVGTVSGVRTQLFLATCKKQLELDDRMLLPEVRGLLEGNEAKQHMVDTLISWLSEAGNVARTAARLRVHEQTVRYRLRKLRDFVELDNPDPDYLLTLWVQLRAMQERDL